MIRSGLNVNLSLYGRGVKRGGRWARAATNSRLPDAILPAYGLYDLHQQKEGYAMDTLPLTPHQLAFIDIFGYLVFPGLLSDRIDRIIEEFEATFAGRGGGHNGMAHDGKARSCILPFIDQTDYLASLLDDPRIDCIFTSLLGDDYQYLGSDGNFYVGDSNWHSDTDWSGKSRGKPPRIFYKLALYLDPVRAATGALRVIPGSHRYGDRIA